ncbi:MAG: hypothetical protein WDM92_11845 [Caulobacteraceae bacterium]
MLDLLGQHLDPRVVVFLARLHVLDLGDQVLGALVLDHGLLDQVGLVDGLLGGRVEQLLLDLHVDLQRQADLAGDLLLGVVVLGVLEGLEQRLDLAVLLFEELRRLDGGRGGGGPWTRISRRSCPRSCSYEWWPCPCSLGCPGGQQTEGRRPGSNGGLPTKPARRGTNRRWRALSPGFPRQGEECVRWLR